MTKITTLIFSLIGLVVFLWLNAVGAVLGKPGTIVFLPVFIISLVLFFLKDQIFHKWLKFLYVWLPLAVIIVLLVPQYDNSLLNLQKDSVVLVSSILFLIASISIIVYFSLKDTSRH